MLQYMLQVVTLVSAQCVACCTVVTRCESARCSYGRVEDIGLAVVYLSGPAGGFITATTIIVDGGQWHGTSGSFQMAKKIIAKKAAKEKTSHKGGVPVSKL